MHETATFLPRREKDLVPMIVEVGPVPLVDPAESSVGVDADPVDRKRADRWRQENATVSIEGDAPTVKEVVVPR
jgi:hypothetical protein